MLAGILDDAKNARLRVNPARGIEYLPCKSSKRRIYPTADVARLRPSPGSTGHCWPIRDCAGVNVLARMLGHTDPSVTDMHFYQRKYINGSYPRSSVVTMAVAASGVAHNHSADTVGAARTGAGVGVVLATQVGHTRSVA